MCILIIGEKYFFYTFLCSDCTNLIKNGVTHTEDIHDHRVLQQGQKMVWHSLPEMEQEVLYL